MNDLLLVDDEQAVLQSLSQALDWSEYGFSHIHTAGSAREAMEILENFPIDLLLLDIQMPDMTGLEMLKAIRNRYPGTHCILISAYSKFEYAKEALLLNVENYLLKPIDINELRETVSHAAENIAKVSGSAQNLFEKNFLERWLYGHITSDELMEHSQYTHYNVLMRHYCAVIVQSQNPVETVLRSMAAALPREIAAYPLAEDAHTGILLCGGHEFSDLYIEEAAAPLKAARHGLRIICGSCGIGSGNVNKSLADARHTLEYARLSSTFGYLSFRQVPWELLTPPQMAAFHDLVQIPPSKSQIRSFLSDLVPPVFGSAPDYRSVYALLCLALRDMRDEPDSRELPFPPLPAPGTEEACAAALTNAILLFCEEKQQGMRNLSPIVRRVVRYIRDNLGGSVSLKHFCEQTSMNPTYIGRLFREETGVYFSDYVCMLRIQKAKLLLGNTDYSVSDIARQVGIYDVSYFVQCFKKQEQISPLKYRQATLQSQNKTRRNK